MMINSYLNSSTGYSPFFLNYGYHPIAPVGLLKGDEDIKIESVENFVSGVQLIWNQATKYLLSSVEKQQKYYNMHHRAVEHRIGDLVLLSSKNLSFKNIPAKLQKKFVGPFEVIEKIGSQAYRLKLPDSWTIHDVFHISLLKKWKTAVFRADTTEPKEELHIEERKTEKIEKLLRWKKTGRGQPHAYLVLWEGLPLEDASWEPTSYFNPQELQSLLERDSPPKEIS